MSFQVRLFWKISFQKIHTEPFFSFGPANKKILLATATVLVLQCLLFFSLIFGHNGETEGVEEEEEGVS